MAPDRASLRELPDRPGSEDVPRAPDDKRARILAAAREVCARMGYEAATMDAVAAEARVSKGTLYNFFDNKEHLFLSTVLQAYEAAEARVQARVASVEEPRARMAGLIDALVSGFPEVAAGMMVNLQVWALVARDATARDRMFEDLRTRYARLDSDLADTLRAGQKAGDFRSDVDPRGVAQSLSALYDGFVYRSVFDPERAEPERLRAALEGLIRDRALPENPASGDEEIR